MTWFSVFDQSLTLVNATDDRQFHRFTIEGVSASQLAIATASPDTRPTWHLGCYVRVFAPIADLPGSTALNAAEVQSQGVTIGRTTLLQVPAGIDQPLQIVLEIPYWYRRMDIQIWRRGAGLDVGDRQLLTADTAGQTVFSLAIAPTEPEQTELFINGIKATYTTEYKIEGTTLTWLSPLQLDPTDEIEVIYL